MEIKRPQNIPFISTRTKFNELKSEFTYILRKFLFLPNRNNRYYDTKKLKTFLIKDINMQEVIAINPDYLENPVESSNNYELRIFKEDDNTKLVHATISFLIEMQSKKEIDEEDLLDAYDKVIVALDCLSKSINESGEKITEKKNWTICKYNELKQQLYGIVPEVVDDISIEKNFQTRIVDLICNPSFKIKDVHFTFNEILSTITENKNTNEKIKSYIDDIFIFLLLILIRQRTMEAGIELDELLGIIDRNVIQRLLESDKIDKHHFEIQDYKSLKEKSNKSIVGFLWRRDIHFWFNIINLSKKTELQSCNFSSDIPNYLTEELRQYRNMAAHSSGNAIGAKWLVRTLRAIITFTKKLGEENESWNVETALLEKRYTFEIYNEDMRTQGKAPIKKYGDILFHNHPTAYFKREPIKSWKNVLKFKGLEECNNQPIPTERPKKLSERADVLINYFFNELTAEEEMNKNFVINQIKNFYKYNRVLFPFWINDTGFNSLIEKCYPFSPMFFLVTKDLDFLVVLDIAEECISNAIKTDESHPLLMPYDIDFLEPCEPRQTILGYYSAGQAITTRFLKEHSIDYYNALVDFPEDYKLKSIIEESESKEFSTSSDVYSSVWKSIILLSVDEIRKTYGAKYKNKQHTGIPSCEWIRLCSCQPGESIWEVETFLYYISIYNPYALPDNPFQLIKPSNYKDEMEKLFYIAKKKTNPFTLSIDLQKQLAENFAKSYLKVLEDCQSMPADSVNPLFDITEEGHKFLESFLKESEDNNYYDVLSSFSQHEIAVLENLLKEFPPKIEHRISIPVSQFTKEQIKCLAKLYGECSAKDYKKEETLRRQILQYTHIVWDYHRKHYTQ